MRYLFLVLIAILGLYWLFVWLDDGFQIDLIAPRFAYRETIELPQGPLTLDEVRHTLDQPFYYLGRGAQFYVFLSEDGEHVLKIVKQKHLRAPWWKRGFFYLTGHSRPWKERTQKLLYSLRLATNELPEQSLVSYLHFKPTTTLKTTTVIHDKLGFSYALDMDQQEFMLQKRAHNLLKQFDEWVEKKDFSTIQLFGKRLMTLILLLREKGIDNSDLQSESNIGVLNEKPVFIDIGSFEYAPHPMPEKLVQKIFHPLVEKLSRFPEEKKLLENIYNQ